MEKAEERQGDGLLARIPEAMSAESAEPSVAVITSVIFDLSEVLLTGIKETGIDLGRTHGTDFSAVERGPSGAHNPLMLPAVWEFFHGNLSEDEYLAEVVRTYPAFGSHAYLKEHIRANFKEVQGTRDIVNRVRKAGYRLALLSVHGREWIDYCETIYNLHALFDVIVYSYIDKVSKPEPEAFLRTLARLEAQPQECLFVDDSERNIVAAQNLGIAAILFTHADALEADLRRLLPRFR